MSFRLMSKVKHSICNRVGLATVLSAAVGVMGLMPLQASALTTPPSGSLQLVGSNVCAQVSGYISGSTVSSATCDGLIHQKFYLNRAGYYNGQIAYTLETAKASSYQCLNDVNKSTAAGAPVNLATCNGINSAERFVYVNSSNGGNELFNVASGECLDAGSVLGDQLVLNPCDANAASQLWFQGPNAADPFSS